MVLHWSSEEAFSDVFASLELLCVFFCRGGILLLCACVRLPLEGERRFFCSLSSSSSLFFVDNVVEIWRDHYQLLRDCLVLAV